MGRYCGIDSVWIERFLDRLKEQKADPERAGNGEEDEKAPSPKERKPHPGPGARATR